jgi:predicted Zn-dependent peptidase
MFELNTAAITNYQITTVPNDPMNVKIVTLQNGLKLFLSVHKEEPRIFTNIAVRAGSKFDPADTTGLAHYLEHMMFKGTSKIGALDWEKESQLLQQISECYEAHKQETDPEKRAALYRQIDMLSNEAARYVAANEYDKLVSALGAKNTNAYTWVEQTVYVNDIPSNELERWMKLEAERFRMVALRLFHTELETVYEEFNISQDRDIRKAMKALNLAIFPTHPYGTQTTIGEGEHLKSPSHQSIHRYFDTYYVPNNMAIVIAGDFDEEEAIAYAEKYWGKLPARKTPIFTFQPQPELIEPVRREVKGREAEFLMMAWRLPKAADLSSIFAELVGVMLFNGQAGLFDLALNNQQVVLKSQAWSQLMEDYSLLQTYAMPREGQSLEEVEQLILQQIQRLQTGDFPDWLLPAVITNMKLDEAKRLEKNENRTAAITTAYVCGVDWQKYCSRFERMQQIQKQDIIDFANRFLGENYAIVYKRLDTPDDVMKVAKPPITPISLNRDAISDFTKEFIAIETPRLQPEFIDYKQVIETITYASLIDSVSQSANIYHITKGENSGLFQLHYIYEMGKLADKEIGFAVNLLPYLGTSKFSAVELHQEFFKLGLYFNVSCNDDRTFVSLSGLEENLIAGIELFEHILADAVPNTTALQNVVADALKTRENNKKNREFILRNAMLNYAKFGDNSPFLDSLTAKELLTLDADILVQKIKQLADYEHDILFVGQSSLHEIHSIIKEKHRFTSKPKSVLSPKTYTEQPNENKVFLLDFPMVQVDIMFLSKGNFGFRLEEYILAEFYNDYFGQGLSSIFFQEIREARALGYAAWAAYTSPLKNDRSHYLQAYVGTQPDKLQDALPAIHDILQNMPIFESQIESARAAILKRLESSRVNGANVFWQYRNNLARGFNHDIRQDVYQKMQQLTIAEVQQFQKDFIQNRQFDILLVGKKEALDLDYLKNWGTIVELSIEQIFGE